jgi:hypothetical protein
VISQLFATIQRFLVLASLEADGDGTAVAVAVPRLTANRRPFDSISQRKACLLPKTPAFARRPHTELAALFYGSRKPLSITFDRIIEVQVDSANYLA